MFVYFEHCFVFCFLLHVLYSVNFCIFCCHLCLLGVSTFYVFYVCAFFIFFTTIFPYISNKDKYMCVIFDVSEHVVNVVKIVVYNSYLAS